MRHQVDYNTFFNIVSVFVSERELRGTVRILEDLKESYNLKKSSLFLHHFSSRYIIELNDLIELDDLMKDEDNKIKEIAKSIFKTTQHRNRSMLATYPFPITTGNSKDIFSILATEQNYDLAYLEFIKPINLIKAIETVKNANLPGEYHIIKDLLAVNKELVIKNFEKIVINFRHELDVLYLITECLGTLSGQDKVDAYKFSETEDPVIRLLISDILKKKPDEGIIKECIEIFKEEKSDKNKIALFNLLHHVLDPFAR